MDFVFNLSLFFFGFFKYQNYFLFCEIKSWFPFLIAL